ncbi:hypothetical protein Bbelb_317740 [Branchiostoma belcheri]|nr:hypothetical protein Bbelb_317740 [Branchiostoma belcheri]
MHGIGEREKRPWGQNRLQENVNSDSSDTGFSDSESDISEHGPPEIQVLRDGEVTWEKDMNGTTEVDQLSKDELVKDLSCPGSKSYSMSAKALQVCLKKELHGIKRPPALLFNFPGTSFAASKGTGRGSSLRNVLKSLPVPLFSAICEMVAEIVLQGVRHAAALILDERRGELGQKEHLSGSEESTQLKVACQSTTRGVVHAFHADMSPKAKDDILQGFREGRIRIIVATFGMGIDVPDVNGVVVYGNVDETYQNDKHAKAFAMYIHESMFATVKSAVDDAEFFSILSDGSTDSANVQEEIVYVQVLENFRPVIKSVALKPLQKADAESITRELVEVMEQDLRDKLCAAGVDGANVMMGHVSGVVTRLKDESSGQHVLGIHCSGHKLELAYKYTLNDVAYFRNVTDTLHTLYKFYQSAQPVWPQGNRCCSGLPSTKTCQHSRNKMDWTYRTCTECRRQEFPCNHLEQVAQGTGESKDKARHEMEEDGGDGICITTDARHAHRKNSYRSHILSLGYKRM